MENEGRLSIKNWAEEDRPREKFMTHGASSLSNAELLAILIGSGTPKLSAVDVCKKLMDSFDNDLNSLMKADMSKLTKVEGIGPAKAVTIMAALELARRRKRDKKQQFQIGNSQEIFEYVRQDLEELDHEELWVLFLSHALRVVDFRQFSMGGIASTAFDQRPILRRALEVGATCMVLLHNHPSGNLHPSEQDRKITQILKQAGQTLSIELIDHLIIGDGGDNYYSFADNSIL